MFRKFYILLLTGFTIISVCACKKKAKTVQDNIAYQTVNITIYPGDPLYVAKLGHIGGWMYINGGVNGIIVYRKTQNSSADFIALERTSTYLPDNPYAAVKVQPDNFTLKDTISGSKWQIIDGAVMLAPATMPLRAYTTLYDNGTGALMIRN
jgi:hypothetical protein